MHTRSNFPSLLSEFHAVDARLPERARARYASTWSKRCEEQLARIAPTDRALLLDACRSALARGPLALPIAIASYHSDPHAVLVSFGPEWLARARSAEIDLLISDVFGASNVQFARGALASREVSR